MLFLYVIIIFPSQQNPNLMKLQLGKSRKHRLLWSLVTGREIPTTHPGMGLEGATGAGGRCSGGQNRRDREVCPASADCAAPGPGGWRRTPTPRQSKGRWGDGWSCTEIPQGRQNWQLNIKPGHFPRPARSSDMLTKREELLQNRPLGICILNSWSQNLRKEQLCREKPKFCEYSRGSLLSHHTHITAMGDGRRVKYTSLEQRGNVTTGASCLLLDPLYSENSMC